MRGEIKRATLYYYVDDDGVAVHFSRWRRKRGNRKKTENEIYTCIHSCWQRYGAALVKTTFTLLRSGSFAFGTDVKKEREILLRTRSTSAAPKINKWNATVADYIRQSERGILRVHNAGFVAEQNDIESGKENGSPGLILFFMYCVLYNTLFVCLLDCVSDHHDYLLKNKSLWGCTVALHVVLVNFFEDLKG